MVAMPLRHCHDLGDGATLSLRFDFFLYKIDSPTGYMLNKMSTFKDANKIVVVAMLQLANMNHRHHTWMTSSKLDGGDWEEHWILCPSLVNCRQNAATCWPLYPTNA